MSDMKNNKENAGTAAVLRRCGFVGALLATLAGAEASNRRFAYSYETTTMPAGAREYETWVTWKTSPAEDSGFNRFDIRHEFEFGVTDRLQLAWYVADWRYEESSSESGKTDFRDMALEAIYSFTDPNRDWLGSAVYGEVKVGDDFIELESKLLLQKNFGPLALVYNVGGAVEWEHSYKDDEGELMQSAGLSYQIDPSWAVGLEVLHECELEDVEDFGDNAVYVGPNVTYRSENWWAIMTAMWQATTLDGEPDFQLRAILAFDF